MTLDCIRAATAIRFPPADNDECPTNDDVLLAIRSVNATTTASDDNTSFDETRAMLHHCDCPTNPPHIPVSAISTEALGTPEECSLPRLTRRHLRTLPNWSEWLAAEAKQLDAHRAQGMYSSPVDPPPGAIVLRQHWTYSLKADPTSPGGVKRKARNCCDGSSKAAPELHRLAQTYSSCVQHCCMRLFFALAAAENYHVVSVDATNAYANSPPPTVPTYVKIDEPFAEWYFNTFGQTVDRKKVLRVLHALQGHPEAGALWESYIVSILTDIGFKCTSHECNLYVCVPLVDDPQLPAFPQTNDPTTLECYFDASHASDLKTRRSVSGIVYNTCGAAINYRAAVQPTVATSSTEAEFICAVDAAKGVKYLRYVHDSLGFKQVEPTNMYGYNEASIEMVNACKPTNRARHIDIQYFAIQEWKDNGDLVLLHIPGVINCSDALTKACGWTLHHRHCRRYMGHYGRPPSIAA